MGRDGLLGAFEEQVLLAVARGRGDAYGMTVRREIEDKTGRDITIGAVYATLDRLESKGLLRSHLGDAAEGRRGKRTLPERGKRRKILLVEIGSMWRNWTFLTPWGI